MEAKPAVTLVLLFSVLSSSGCAVFVPRTQPTGASPSARSERNAVPANAQAPQPSDPVEQRVMEYIARVEQHDVAAASPADSELAATAGSDGAPPSESRRPTRPSARSPREKGVGTARRPPDIILSADTSADPAAASVGASDARTVPEIGEAAGGATGGDVSRDSAPRPHDSELNIAGQTRSEAVATSVRTSPAAQPLTSSSISDDASTERTAVRPGRLNRATESAQTTGETSSAAMEPPSISFISLRPAAPGISAESSSSSVETAAAPGVNSPARAVGGGPTAQELISAFVRDNDPSSDATFRKQIDLRLMRVVAGDLESARKPLEMATAEQQAIASRLIEALIAARDAHDGDAGVAADRVLAPIRALSEALRETGPLEIPMLALCREVRGFGQYQPFDPPQFAAGRENEFVLYCELSNFSSRQQSDGQYMSQFELRTTILHGKDVVLEWIDRDITDRCRNRRRDCFIPRVVRLPASLAPGGYVAKIAVIDKLGEKVAERSAEFRIAAQ